ncbi:hybrid sensor histidine kinase/response regulator [Tropicimonas marinistellae]|uniref:hybrid sensor histidine kinase/response regulator n=1 Tax=Tropicimonas marinistellae TaxID=1739787 RepID=UPI000837A4DC|nr:ATP-binding protein [Tropicimonas marinistellae]
MEPRTEAADRNLEAFRARQSVEGRFLSYCRGRSRHFWTRQMLIIACAPVFLAMADVRTAIYIAFIVFLGDAVDCLLLRYLGKRSALAARLPLAMGVTTLTGGLQAVTVILFVALVESFGGADARTFASAICLAGLLDASLLYGVHRAAALVRIIAYLLALTTICAQSFLHHTIAPQSAYFDVSAAVMVAYVGWVFSRHVHENRLRRSANQMATLESARELAHANVALEQSRQVTRRLAMVAERANDSVIITDAEGVITWVNRAFTLVTGYSFAESVGRNVSFLNAPDTDPEVVKELRSAREQRRPVRAEIMNRHKNGQPIWIEVNMAPVFDEDGELERIVSVERDISEAKKREHALAEARLAAEREVRTRHNFLATMSHEIRTPMNGVIGTADLLMETSLDETQRGLLRTITSSGEALLAIVNDILDFSKLESGRLEVAADPFCPERCLRHAVDLVRPLAEAKGLSLQLVLPTSLPLSVVGDEGRIRQVVLNLLGNAIKFTETGGITIDVGVKLDDDACRFLISVRDTGVGINPERIGHVFESFAQADANIAGRFGGTGLGLSISRLLIQAMGGEISAASTPGQGSVFFVSLILPVSAETSRPVTDGITETSRVPSQCLAGLNVLVAEDNKTNTLLLEKMLSSFGVTTIFATNGREAVEFYDLHRPDLVLMDMHMPILDGLAATREIRAREIRNAQDPVPIVALTANAFPEDRNLCLEAGMNDVVTKPFRKEDLRVSIATHCGRLSATDSTVDVRSASVQGQQDSVGLEKGVDGAARIGC